MLDIYNSIVGYYDDKGDYHLLDDSFKFYEKLSIGKHSRYKNVLYNGVDVIKGRTKVRCECSSCKKENDVNSLYSFKAEKRNHKYICPSCSKKGVYSGEKANKIRSVKSNERYLKDFGRVEKAWLEKEYVTNKKSMSQISHIVTGEYGSNDFYRCIRYIKTKMNEYGIKRREGKDIWKIPSIRQRNIKNGSTGKNVSGLSKKTKNILEDMNIEYIMEHTLGNYRYDFFIPSKNIIIECNGDYWHCNPDKYSPDFYHRHYKMTAQEKWVKDKKKEDFAKENGFKVLTFWEEEINSENYRRALRYGIMEI